MIIEVAVDALVDNGAVASLLFVYNIVWNTVMSGLKLLNLRDNTYKIFLSGISDRGRNQTPDQIQEVTERLY